MKKQSTVYFLFLACFLQLGHSIFPHTHVEEHHHDGKNHHHHDSSENGLSLFFSHINHNSEVFSTNHLENVVKVVNEVPASLPIVPNTSLYSNLVVLRPKKELQFREEPLVIISPHLCSLQFRGPPTLI
jgi:hypothetical protein